MFIFTQETEHDTLAAVSHSRGAENSTTHKPKPIYIYECLLLPAIFRVRLRQAAHGIHASCLYHNNV